MTDVILRVNRASSHPVQVPVAYQDETIIGHIQEFEVELHHEDGQHGSMVLRFRKAGEVAEAKSVFTAGGTVKMSFSKADDPAPVAVSTDLSQTTEAPAAPSA